MPADYPSTRTTTKFIGLFLAAATLMALMPALAQAPLMINAYSSEIDFGIIANENGICRMNERGNLIGLNGQSCLGSGDRAIFSITGEPGQVVYIEVTGSSEQGITFTPDISGSSTKVISSGGSTLLVLSGDLLLNNAASGVHSLDYLLCVHYE